MDPAPYVNLSALKRANEVSSTIKNIVSTDELLSLAKQGLCPCYILTNPATQDQSYWFDPREVKKWLLENHCVVQGGVKMGRQPYQFLSFGPDDIVRNTEELPPELASTETLYRLPDLTHRMVPGVYFLCRDKRIVYIGQSGNVAARLSWHVSAGKLFDSAYFIACPLENLNAMETALIKKYKPELNIAGVQEGPRGPRKKRPQTTPLEPFPTREAVPLTKEQQEGINAAFTKVFGG